MTALNSETRRRIAPLLRLLVTDEDSETLAALSAMRRVLAWAGADLHALADALVAELGTDRADAAAWHSHIELARFCGEHLDELSDGEADFILTIKRPWARRRGLSPKQREWLQTIAERLQETEYA